ncbi:MAG TPA: PadR family transcriptional regulator [Frankiaceae bacterium]|nr:PadR family transcriptional regulator [Frankiaceae bacterium]
MNPITNPGRSQHRHHHPAEHPFAGHRQHHRHGPFGPGPFGGQFEDSHRGRHGHPGRRPGRGRAQRGDVRTAALILLAEQPMHGYQLMQAIAERTAGAWQPSPGAIYPTLNQLQDEGLIGMETEGGRKLASLTDAGRTYIDEQGESMPDPFAEFAGGGADRTDLRRGIEEIATACRQIGRGGTEAQLAAAQKVLVETRRSLYLILAEDPGALGTDEAPSES